MEWIANGKFEGIYIYCTILYYTILHYTILHCTTLHYTALLGEVDLQDKGGKPVGRVSLACRFERPNAKVSASSGSGSSSTILYCTVLYHTTLY
jgi:hypothetical protein